jgi:predicted permease
MKKYQLRKFKRFASGLIFAIISTIALVLCLADMNANSQSRMFLCFSIAAVSLLMGLISMFRNDEAPKEKI